MAHTKSAEKRMRQNEKRRLRTNDLPITLFNPLHK